MVRHLGYLYVNNRHLKDMMVKQKLPPKGILKDNNNNNDFSNNISNNTNLDDNGLPLEIETYVSPFNRDDDVKGDINPDKIDLQASSVFGPGKKKTGFNLPNKKDIINIDTDVEDDFDIDIYKSPERLDKTVKELLNKEPTLKNCHKLVQVMLGKYKAESPKKTDQFMQAFLSHAAGDKGAIFNQKASTARADRDIFIKTGLWKATYSLEVMLAVTDSSAIAQPSLDIKMFKHTVKHMYVIFPIYLCLVSCRSNVYLSIFRYFTIYCT